MNRADLALSVYTVELAKRQSVDIPPPQKRGLSTLTRLKYNIEQATGLTEPNQLRAHIHRAFSPPNFAPSPTPDRNETKRRPIMDPYSAEGELINIHNHFHQGQYQEVVDFDTSSLSPENELPARVLALRARIALGQAEDVLADVQGETSEPDLAAVAALAQSALGRTEEAVQAVEELAQSAADNRTVQVLGGTVLQAAGKSDEAIALLSKHSGSRTYYNTPVHESLR